MLRFAVRLFSAVQAEALLVAWQAGYREGLRDGEKVGQRMAAYEIRIRLENLMDDFEGELLPAPPRETGDA